MYQIRLDGKDIASPISYTLGFEKIYTEDSGRLDNGTASLEVLAAKRTVSLGFGPLSWQECAGITEIIEGKKQFSVEYPDPRYPGKSTIKTFYPGRYQVAHLNQTGNSVWWEGLAFDLIEV